MSSGFPRNLRRDNEVDCGRGARHATFAGTGYCREKKKACFTCGSNGRNAKMGTHRTDAQLRTT